MVAVSHLGSYRQGQHSQDGMMRLTQPWMANAQTITREKPTTILCKPLLFGVYYSSTRYILTKTAKPCLKCLSWTKNLDFSVANKWSKFGLVMLPAECHFSFSSRVVSVQWMLVRANISAPASLLQHRNVEIGKMKVLWLVLPWEEVSSL